MADEFSKFVGIIPIERAPPSKDAISMTLEEYAEASHAAEQAVKFGNYVPLKKRLRTPGAKLLSLELTMAADIIPNEAGRAGGGFKRPPHRPAQPEKLRTRQRLFSLDVLALVAKGQPRKKAVSTVAERNKTSISTVSTAVRAMLGL
jgi:hypothetical protein